MADEQELKRQICAKMEPARGFYALGMFHDALRAIEGLPPDDKAHRLVVMLRLDILLALHRLIDAITVGRGACRQWPFVDVFFLKTVTAFMELNDHQQAKDLLLTGPPSLQQKAIYWYIRARCHSRLEDLGEAKKCLQECFNRDLSFRQRALDEPDLAAVWESLFRWLRSTDWNSMEWQVKN